ncbi:hypothetical protein ACFQL8_34215 [Streptomyces goshikiensis]|uniref:hypothetical protein n=1 Tax=Streptomyces goshikiensis TaxID=1942 RepID=UPI001672E537|nr:hypothetical protein [Streptomyces goshikiensis]
MVDVRQAAIGGSALPPSSETGTARVVLRGDADDREQVATLLENSLHCTREDAFQDDQTILDIALSQAH